MIRVQEEDFDVGKEIDLLIQNGVGAVASFVGLVRGKEGDDDIKSMTLEYYPGMTEKKLGEIENIARKRWTLENCLIIHRFGRLSPSDKIVLVVTTSSHRQDALESCAFLMDWLKTDAPFWKLEERGSGSQWVSARDSDTEALNKWNQEK